MDTQLLLYLNNQWQAIDLYEDIPITVVVQETDITDFQGRKSSFTKQFTIPGTSNNSNIFEHYYEVNGTEFNPLIKVNSVVQYRGTDIFNGICRLQSVIITDTYVDFEIYIMGEVGDFISEIKNKTLQDLNYDDLQHELNYSSITTSWEAKNNDTDGLLGGKILYPLINYGLKYNGTSTTPEITYDFSGAQSFSLSGNSIPPEYFKPSIRLSEVVKRIFNETSYEVNSAFLDSDYFKSIYMDTFLNGKLGIETASAVTNQNLFRTYMRPYTIWTPPDINELWNFLDFETFSPDGYDYLNNFTLGSPTTSYDNPPSATGPSSSFRVPYSGVYSFNFRFNFDSAGYPGSNGWVYFQVVAQKGTNPNSLTTFAATSMVSTLMAPTDFPVNWLFTGNCLTGEYVKLRIFIGQTSNPDNAPMRFKPYSSGGVTTSAPQFDMYAGPTLVGTQLVDLKLGVSNINCVDLIKALVTMFNLVIVQDEGSKTLNILPYNEYYNDGDRTERDWTNKLDLTSSYKVEPISFDLPKEIQFTYTNGSEEHLNKLWEDEKEYNFGRYRFVSSSNLLTETQVYEIPFAALPTSGVTGASNFIIPQTYRVINGRQDPYSTKPHLFFWTGNRYAYTDNEHQVPGYWWMTSGTTPTRQTTYPCVSHLTSLDIYLPNYISDLNFGADFDFFGNSNPYPVQTSSYTLYSSFWQDYIDNNYSNETRRLTGKFYLWPLDIYETKLTDKIFVKDSYYRIEKINDGNLISPQFTEVSLIKERGGYYDINPPSPYYYLTGNTAYPTFVAPNLIPSYSSLSQADVCTTGTVVTNIYLYGPAPYSDGAFVATLSGGIYSPVPQGTYIRWIGGGNTYVVINNLGQILQIDC